MSSLGTSVAGIERWAGVTLWWGGLRGLVFEEAAVDVECQLPGAKLNVSRRQYRSRVGVSVQVSVRHTPAWPLANDNNEAYVRLLALDSATCVRRTPGTIIISASQSV